MWRLWHDPLFVWVASTLVLKYLCLTASRGTKARFAQSFSRNFSLHDTTGFTPDSSFCCSAFKGMSAFSYHILLNSWSFVMIIVSHMFISILTLFIYRTFFFLRSTCLGGRLEKKQTLPMLNACCFHFTI